MTMKTVAVVQYQFVCNTCGTSTPRAGSPAEALELASELNGDDWEIVPSTSRFPEMHFCSPECLDAWEDS